MVSCRFFDYPLFLTTAYVLIVVEQIGVSYFVDDVQRVCCAPTPEGNTTAPNNDTHAEGFCEERENLQFQQDTLGCANAFLLVCLLVLGVTHLLTFSAEDRVSCVSNAADVLRFVARRGILNFFALLAMFTISIAMGMSIALIRHTCIKDTPVFDVYRRYISLGLFNTVLVLVVLTGMLARMDNLLNLPRGGRSEVKTYKRIKRQSTSQTEDRISSELLAEGGGDEVVVTSSDVAAAGFSYKGARIRGTGNPRGVVHRNEEEEDLLALHTPK
jgi:hypothetical protein